MKVKMKLDVYNYTLFGRSFVLKDTNDQERIIVNKNFVVHISFFLLFLKKLLRIFKFVKRHGFSLSFARLKTAKQCVSASDASRRSCVAGGFST